MSGLTSLFVTRDGSENGTTPKGARHALGGLLLQAGDALLNSRKGVLMDNGSANVVTGKSDMSFDVRAAVFVGQASTAQGPWVGANDATVNVATDPAPGSNSRYDIICVRQHLVAGDGGIDSDVVLEFFVEQGVVAGVPVVPSTPSGAVKLAEALITTGMVGTDTATITQTFDWTVARGGVLPVASAAQLASLTPHLGQVIHDGTESPKTLKVWDGTAWRAVQAASAWVTPTLTGGWSNFGSPYGTARHRKEGDVVRLVGVVKSGGVGAGNPILTLPAGSRPSGDIHRVVSTASNGSATLVITTAGVVYIVGYHPGGGSNGAVSLDGITFSTTA